MTTEEIAIEFLRKFKKYKHGISMDVHNTIIYYIVKDYKFDTGPVKEYLLSTGLVKIHSKHDLKLTDEGYEYVMNEL